ncbi:MAG: hypothetical protein IPI60_17990 [Saprospiraceae bacterium]|nr:hypothetical protein [Saprospiraceae bacterium]
MKKQPLDIHPVDQFMQALDAEIQPVMNEFHWSECRHCWMKTFLRMNYRQQGLLRG